MQIQSSQSSRHQELEALWKQRIASLETAAAPRPPPTPPTPPPQAVGVSVDDDLPEAHLRCRAWSAIVSALAAFTVISETLRNVDETRRRSSQE